MELGHLDLSYRDPIETPPVSSLPPLVLLLSDGHVVWLLYPGQVDLVWEGAVVALAVTERLVPIGSPRVQSLANKIEQISTGIKS